MWEVDGDAIHIERLEISARVGVPDIERTTPQRLVVSLTVWPQNQFDAVQDELARTVDYAAMAKSARAFVEQRCDKLIETLAATLAAHLLERFTIRAVRIELRKFVLPNCDHVAVILTRERAG
jgi:dihydroneopterin aldolase